MDPLKDLPLGFGMALVQNEKSLLRFGEMPEAQKRKLLEEAHRVTSKKEMRALVDRIGKSAEM